MFIVIAMQFLGFIAFRWYAQKMSGGFMDITLERIFSLIPKKPDGKFVHGAKKNFCDSIEAPPNIMSEWERGISKSYRNYLYAISAKYNVSVEWLKGKADDPTPLTGEGQKKPAFPEEDELNASLIEKLIQLTPEELEKVDAFVQGLLASRWAEAFPRR